MNVRTLRLWLLAGMTVIAGSWWQLALISAQAATPDHRAIYTVGNSQQFQLGSAGANQTPARVLRTQGVPIENAVDAAVGGAHMLFVRADGALWGLGSNAVGQLGIGGNVSQNGPAPVPGLTGATKVAAALDHSLVLDSAGRVWAFGSNADGKLGLSSLPAPVNVPGMIPSLSNVVDVAAGVDFSMALLSDGTVWTWGSNSAGQLGDAGPSRYEPAQVPLDSGVSIVKIAAGYRTALALTADGTLIGWGRNQAGELVLPASPSSLPVPIASGIAAADAGDAHVIAASTDGSVMTRGLNLFGQLGVSGAPSDWQTVPGLSEVVDVAAGAAHSIAVTAGGVVWSWGNNSNRQLGTPSLEHSSTPAQVTSVPRLARSADAFGNSSLFLTDPGAAVVEITAPANASCGQPLNVSVSLTGYNDVSVLPNDMVLVIDESGSIGAQNFNVMMDALAAFVGTQSFANPLPTRIAIVMFSYSARQALAFSTDRAQIMNTLQSMPFMDGTATCIGCGIQKATELLNTTGRPGAKRTIVVVTDGENNEQEYYFNQVVQQAKNTSTIFAIGIGDDVDAAQIDFIASDLTGVQTAFLTPDFQSLNPILGQLAVNTTPAIRNLTVSLRRAAPFEAAGAPVVTTGIISSAGGDFTWTLPTLGGSPVTLTLPMRSSGGGHLPVFDRVAYTYQYGGGSYFFESPSVMVTGCPAAIALSPPQATRLTGQVHSLNVSVTDDFATPLAVPATVSVVSGPNAGRTFNLPPGGALNYTSHLPGVDELVASVPGTALGSTATVTWELPNSLPTVNAGPDQTITLNGTTTALVTLVGGATDDDRVQPLTFSWSENGSPLPGDNAAVLVTRPVGTYTYTFTAFDGEHSSSDTLTVAIVDATAPAIMPVITGPAGANGFHVGATTVTWQVEDLESAITSAPCAAATFSADGAAHTAQCSATSAGGTSSADAVVRIDTAPPLVSAPGQAVMEATSDAGAEVNYSGEAASDATSGVASFACTPASGNVFAIGTTTVTCTATDAAGHSASAATTVIVRDTTPPDLSPLPNITEAGVDPSGRAIVWAPSAADLVGPVTTSCTPAPGSTFGYGTTTVACTATDAHGNTDTESFTVTITDGTPPLVSAAVAGTQGQNGWYTSDVTIDWTIADPQSGITSSTGCASRLVNTDGQSTATCSATSAGGTTTEVASVRRDATPPVLEVPAAITAAASSVSGAEVTFTINAVDAMSGLANSTCSHASGATFPIGSTTVECSAADHAGNVSNGTFIVTVTDTIPPVIAGVTPSAAVINSANHKMVPISVSVSATDNLAPAPACSIAGVTSNEPQDGLGDGDTPVDWLITGRLTLQLRAERSGKGDGRIYTVTIQCVDGSGNAATSTTTVSVPKPQKK